MSHLLCDKYWSECFICDGQQIALVRQVTWQNSVFHNMGETFGVSHTRWASLRMPWPQVLPCLSQESLGQIGKAHMIMANISACQLNMYLSLYFILTFMTK